MKNIGIKVQGARELQKGEENDKNCPYTGSLRVHKRTYTGIVVSDKMSKTCVVEWEGRRYVTKYERYEKARTRVKAHNPPVVSAKVGDRVRIAACRPLSKTKHFVIIAVLHQGVEGEGK